MSAAPLASVPLAVNNAPACCTGTLPLRRGRRRPAATSHPARSAAALAVLAQRIRLSEDAELPETAVDDELLVIFANAG